MATVAATSLGFRISADSCLHWKIHTVDPANQHRLLDLPARATGEFVSRVSGFVSSTLHRCLDGTKVTMYAQWRSAEDYESMGRDTGPLPFSKRRAPSRSLTHILAR